MAVRESEASRRRVWHHPSDHELDHSSQNMEAHLMAVQVAIPSIGHSDLLASLVEKCSESDVYVTVYENRHTALSRLIGTSKIISSGVSWRPVPDVPLYGVWNMAISEAKAQGDILILLNDDVAMGDGAIDSVVHCLEENPEYVMVGFDYFTDGDEWPPGRPFVDGELREVQGTFRHHGVGGFAFAVQSTACPLIDESLVWWCGDDDLCCQIIANGGKIGVLHGAKVQHLHPETSAIHYPHLLEAKDRDLKRFEAKWGNR